MNIEYILMISFYTLRSIVAFKSENSIKMALSSKIVRDVYMIKIIIFQKNETKYITEFILKRIFYVIKRYCVW
jgi:hypothetical protein